MLKLNSQSTIQIGHFLLPQSLLTHECVCVLKGSVKVEVPHKQTVVWSMHIVITEPVCILLLGFSPIYETVSFQVSRTNPFMSHNEVSFLYHHPSFSHSRTPYLC